MVRNFAGVLIAVGTGAQGSDWPRQVLLAVQGVVSVFVLDLWNASQREPLVAG